MGQDLDNHPLGRDFPEFKEKIKLFDTDKLPYVIEEGERAANAQLPFIKGLLGGNP